MARVTRRAAAVASALASLSPAGAQGAEGRVVDGESGAPIGGAIVRVQATPAVTFTDREGRFSLEVPGGGRRLVAGAVGYYYQGVELPAEEPIELGLSRVPYDASAPVSLPDPKECAACHPDQFASWENSPMAHGGRNQWVADVFDGTGTPGGSRGFVYTRDSVLAKKSPASECAACHTPERWLASPGSAMPAFADASVPEQRGVSCMVCHQIAEVHLDRTNFPGVHEGAVRMQRGGMVRYGVLGDVDYHSPGRMRASWQPQLRAEVCGACHQDSGDVHGDGTFRGPVSEPTFEEWRASPYADPASDRRATCVDCHTKPLDAPRASGVAAGPARPYGEVRSHSFVGTTAELLDAALSLELQAVARDGSLDVVVRVTNDGAGHHVPTGVTMRNVTLLVEASQEGRALDLTAGPRVERWAGEGDPSQGDWAGLPGRVFAKINEDAEGRGPVVFTEAVRIRLDTRIPALATDESRYRFQLPAAGPTRVTARLVYRRAWRELVKVKGWERDGHGGPLADVTPPAYGHVMAARVVELDARGPRREWSGGCSAASERGAERAPALVVVAALCALVRWRRSRDA
ncbi:MAG: carboxypeptidase regulatory-like domain-containing protein [Polyangiaceae bacterium]|nr:carboxypeptidase regulatory-like domain-containing protein [Polyangiaceae bacterium]